ncbi:hypothetical protein MSAN_00632300 [Mycena sanguinolenta]|uniref:Uncharacterized protein n=1 Tax=Mycena sanguinolenta TaxID=230812 RepID=A0A8H6YZQ7_9AGAR|nr:hypothetical protein MSAN_00632300 [Mycena sanguinolenta]
MQPQRFSWNSRQCFSFSLPSICCPRTAKLHLSRILWTPDLSPTPVTITLERCSASSGGVWRRFLLAHGCRFTRMCPPPNQSHLQLFWRRLKMMLIAIVAPEIMVGFAARQRLGVNILAKKFKFPTTHGMFFCMGGFISMKGNPIATEEQLEDPDLGPEFQKAIRNVNEEDITDKSKGDTLSKGVALLQGLWFILQTLGRAHQRLAITQLEVATLAFAIVNIFIWLLWWNKPLDVQRPIIVGPPMQLDAETITLPVQLPRLDWIRGVIGGFHKGTYKPLSSVSVPSFWSIEVQSEYDTWAYILLALVGTVFGAVHCAAWNVVFPTLVEMWIWRTFSMVIVALPGLSLLIPFMYLATHLKILEAYLGIPAIVGGLIYIAARITLIVLPLVELRSLPASAFVDVNWSTYIPHI